MRKALQQSPRKTMSEALDSAYRDVVVEDVGSREAVSLSKFHVTRVSTFQTSVALGATLDLCPGPARSRSGTCRTTAVLSRHRSLP